MLKLELEEIVFWDVSSNLSLSNVGFEVLNGGQFGPVFLCLKLIDRCIPATLATC